MRRSMPIFSGIHLQNVHIENVDTPIKIEGGPPVHLQNVSASEYSDTGIRARDSHITAQNLHFQSKDARLGWDLEREVIADLYDSTVLDHRDADLRYGPEVQADVSNLTVRDVYDKTRRENPLFPNTGKQDVDMAINTSEKKLRQQRNRSRLRRIYPILEYLYDGLFPFR